MSVNPYRLVNLEIFETSREAMVLVSKIEAAGLPVRSYNAWPSPFVPRALGGIAVKVQARDYETARAIMEDVLPTPERQLTLAQRDRPTFVVLGATLVLLAWQMVEGGGALPVHAPSEANTFVLASIFVWFIMLLEAIRVHGRWWLCASAPIVLLPVWRMLLHT